MAFNSKLPSFRQNKIGEKLRQLISNLLLKEEFYDQNLFGHEITITDVIISSDLRNAKIFVVSFDKEKDDFIIRILNKKRKFIKYKIARNLNTKFVPEIKFFIDTA